MTLKELAWRVKSMRDHQAQYFRERNPWLLTECKRIEREVDAAVKQILTPDRQGDLFEDDVSTSTAHGG